MGHNHCIQGQILSRQEQHSLWLRERLQEQRLLQLGQPLQLEQLLRQGQLLQLVRLLILLMQQGDEQLVSQQRHIQLFHELFQQVHIQHGCHIQLWECTPFSIQQGSSQ